VDPHLYPISVPRSRVSVLSDGEGIPPPGLGGQFAVSTYMIECAIIGYLFNLIYDLSPARLGRGGRRVALISAVHGVRV